MRTYCNSPRGLRIKENALYIRMWRVHHRAKRRGERERRMAAEQMKIWREACWESWRQLYETAPHFSARTPWALYSCRHGLKCG